MNNDKNNFLDEFIENQKVVDNKNVALIDGDIVIYSICCDKKQTEDEIILLGRQSDRTLQQVKLEIDKYLCNIIIEGGCMYYIGCLSNGSFRYDIAKSKPYKGNRSLRELPKYYKEIKQYLIDEWGFIIHKGFEADDLMGIYQNKIIGYNTIIFSIDKDLKQIIGNHYNFRTKEFVDITELNGLYKLCIQILMGDSTDNIEGIPGVGIKTAINILSRVDPVNYMSACMTEYTNRFGLKDGINRFVETFNLVFILRDMVDVIDLPIPISIENFIKEDRNRSGVDFWGE